MRTQKNTLRKPHGTKLHAPSKFLSWVTRIKEGVTTLTAIVTFVAAIMGALVLYATNKGLFADLTKDVYSWLYEGDAWDGAFNNFPEGYIDMPAMKLSDTTMQLVLTNDRGTIDGVMAEKSFCKVGFPHDFKLVKGSVRVFGKSADITIYDYELGYPTNYAEFSVKRDGVVLEVTPKRNTQWFGQNTLRIALDPSQGRDEAMDRLDSFCKAEFSELMKSVSSRPSATGKRELLVK